MKNDEHFGKRGLTPNVLANIRMANERKIFRTEKTISKQNSRIEVWRERNLAKAPPGYSVNLEGPRGHPPEEVTTPVRVQNPVGAKYQSFTILYNEKNKVINKKLQFKIFTNVSKFYKMKKQILFFVLLVVATFASISKSYGQAGHLTPSPGVLYNYAPIFTPTSGATNPTYTWHVTQSTDLIGGASVDGTATGYFTVGTGGLTASSVNITWNAKAVGQTFYLVVQYSETSSLSGCTVSNMKAYEIKPASTLLLAVSRVNADGTANANTSVCAPTFASATVATGTSPTVTYLYNPTVLYYKINASGMDGNWRPSLLLPALQGTANGQVYASVKIATDPSNLSNYTAFPGTLANVTTSGTGMVSSNDYPVTISGKDYYIEVTITNSKYEGLTSQDIPLAVDGFLPTDYSASDIVGGGDYSVAGVFAKSEKYTILSRPKIEPAVTTPASPFINQVP